jgi:Protein of unknown function (DUF3892)
MVKYLMTEFEIVCVIQDLQGIITHVGLNNGQVYPIMTIIDSMPHHSYCTYGNWQKAVVFRKRHPTSGRWFLTTNPDDTRENNLDFLPKCPIR